MNNNWLNKLNKKINYLVAVSGGPDSMFLLDNLVKNGFKVVVCHVNYHKRLSSNVDEEIVSGYCLDNDLTLEIKEVNSYDYTKGNFQDQARNIRYDFIRKMALKYQIYNAVVAHHLDDLLETYLLQKQRKAIVSYYGLRFKSTYKQLAIYRPMLELRKDDIMDYLALNQIKFGYDETNDLLIYERNKIRHQKLKNLTDIDCNLLLSEIKELNSELELLKDELDVIYGTIIDKNIFSVTEFQKYSDNNSLQQMIIYEYLANYDEKLVLKVKKAKIKEVTRILNNTKKANLIINLTDKIWIFKEYKFAYISEKPETNGFFYKIKKNGTYEFNEFDWFNKQPEFVPAIGLNLNKNDYPIIIRNNSGKEVISTISGTKKINRLFIEHKIPYRKRLSWPVIVNQNNEVILVPNLAINKKQNQKKPNCYFVSKQ